MMHGSRCDETRTWMSGGLNYTMKEHDMIVLPTKEGYDRWSEIYEEDGNPLILLEEPHVERLLGNVTGLSILDVGCGTGRHSDIDSIVSLAHTACSRRRCARS